MGVKIVLVDIDRTLFPSLEFSKGARMAALRAMKKEGMKTPVEKAYEVLMKVVQKKGPNYHDHLGEMLQVLGEKDRARLVAAGVAAYHAAKQKIRPFAGARGALLRMRKTGLRLYVASEGKAVKQWDKVLRMGVQKYFDGAFISEEMGVEKCAQFYARIVRKLRVRPEDVLMIGDKMDRDVGPARKAGLHAVLVDRKARRKTEQTVRNLREAADVALSLM
jgi:putative hydrolase of the HAD superfamily